jgi:drug/metabolite transporter (DMT)-like permease
MRLANPPERSRGYAIAIAATVMWSATAIFIRYLNNRYAMPSLSLAFWRDAIVSLALLAALRLLSPARLRLARRHWKFVALYGLVLSLFNASWTTSVRLNGAAVSTVLAYSSPAITAVLARFLFGERLGCKKLLALAMSILGTVLISGAYDLAAWDLNPAGIVAGLASGLAFAVYSLFGKAAAQRGIDSWTALLYTFAVAAIFLLGYNFIPDGSSVSPLRRIFWLQDAWLGWGVLFLLAVAPTVGGYGLYTLSMNYLPAGVANMIATLEPPLTTAQAYIFLGEQLSLTQIVGSVLIVFGVLLLRWKER